MNQITKAVLLAAGRGTRMRDLTQEVPKPMLQVRGKPILEHIIAGLRGAGVREFCVIVGWRAEVVRDYFAKESLHYVTQTKQDGTGKVVELAKDFCGSDAFVLSYGDILVDPINYQALVRLEDETDGIVSVKRNEDVRKGGAIFVNENFEVTDVREKPAPGEPTSPWYNAGIYAFRPSIFDFTARLELSPRGEYELTDAIRALAQSGRKVKALVLQGDWADVRDPEILAQLNAPNA